LKQRAELIINVVSQKKTSGAAAQKIKSHGALISDYEFYWIKVGKSVSQIQSAVRMQIV
jgi:hypothetical protein